MSVSVVLKNVAMTTGEGPHWDEITKTLLHVDIVRGDVHRWDSATGEDTKVHVDGNVGFVVPRRCGGYIVGKDLTLCHLDWETGHVTELACDVESKAFRINDGKCDVTGRVWAGTMQKTRKPVEESAQACAALYAMEKDGTLKRKLDKISLSNGLTWSPDNSTMYYIDSIPRKLYAFNFDAESGEITNQRILREATDGSLGLPDGMTTDCEGKLWVACYGEGKIVRLDPETGKSIQEYTIPDAKFVTSCCFGGDDLADLYVTSKRYEVESDFALHPLGGSVFKMTGLGVKGLLSYMYEG